MKQKNYNIPTVVYFVVTALLIAYFFPREGKFRYQFYEGKPWRYGLLTAPSDFPIYKTDDEVKAEKDSVLRKFEPYYRINPGIQKEEIEKLRANYNNDNSLRSKVSPAYMQYIESSLINLYKNGIISSQDLDELRKEEYSRVNLLENAVAQPRYVSDFFTVRTAYEFIINNCPHGWTNPSCNRVTSITTSPRTYPMPLTCPTRSRRICYRAYRSPTAWYKPENVS